MESAQRSSVSFPGHSTGPSLPPVQSFLLPTFIIITFHLLLYSVYQNPQRDSRLPILQKSVIDEEKISSFIRMVFYFVFLASPLLS